MSNKEDSKTVNSELCECGGVYVDPSGFVITQEGEKIEGSHA